MTNGLLNTSALFCRSAEGSVLLVYPQFASVCLSDRDTQVAHWGNLCSITMQAANTLGFLVLVVYARVPYQQFSQQEDYAR